jgi:poly(beta-D-mannuronate) lyase
MRRGREIKIAFHNGTARTFTFDIQTSTDALSWLPARTGVRSALNNNLQKFDFADVHPARFVRILGHGNSVNAWNILTEVEIFGGPSVRRRRRRPASEPGVAT